MIGLLQRVRQAEVEVEEEVVGRIGRGILLFAAAVKGDEEEDARILADRAAGLRIFEDERGRMNRSLLDVGGECLLVSQFTLAADVRRGRRPSFDRAAPPESARRLVERVAVELRGLGVRVAHGRFGARMLVRLANEGPATFLLDSAAWRRPGRGA